MTGHAKRAHALLSASGAKRWMTCTPSARAEEKYYSKHGQKPESEYAVEGTTAHEYSELILARELGHLNKSQATRKINAFKKRPEKAKYYGPEMEEHVQTYVDFVMERVNAARAVSPDAIVLIEQRLDFSEYVPEGFGTGDVLIVYDGVLELIDLKYGKGVPVSADENPQLMLYGLGAIAEHDILYDIKEVILTIVQPRLDSISSYSIASDELLEWAENEVRPKAELADKGEGEFVPGEHCRWCAIKDTCRARADLALKTVEADFAEDGSIEMELPDPAELSKEEIAEILFVAPEIEKWCKDIQTYALNEALNGEEFDGFKLVEGRSNRKFSDMKAVAERLEGAGLEAEIIYKPKELRSVGDLEKAVGKSRFTEVLEGLIVKPPGKPALVTLDDKRPALNSPEKAAEDFADELLE
ncbi:MAG: DUF2800 domain-containing protein [Solibacillus sp.]|uniref:DUF2800 domain-containing protein n=1 Tax=Solibacillus sp. TaxID=1909654 RepID=UPI00331519B0